MGVGLIAIVFFSIYGITISINNVSLIPKYISCLFMVIGLLKVRKHVKEEYLDYALGICVGLFIISFIAPASNLFDFFIYIFDFLMVYFVLIGVLRISKDYEGIDKYRKHINVFLLFNLILSILLVIDLIVVTFNILLYPLLIYLLYKSCIITYHLFKINNYLCEQYKPVKAVTINPQRKEYKAIAATIMIVSILAIGCLYKPIMYRLEDRSQLQEYGQYGYHGDDVIIGYLGLSAIDNETMGRIPSVYLKDSIIQDDGEFDIIIRSEDEYILNVDNSEYVVDYEDDKYPGYHRIIYNFDFCYDPLKLKDIIKYCQSLDCSIRLYNRHGDEVFYCNKQLEKLAVDCYGYQDDQIEISELAVYDNHILKEPNIHFKNNNYDIANLFIIQENKEYYLESYLKIVDNYILGSPCEVLINNEQNMKIKLVLYDHQGNSETKIYQLELEP